jgi:hypothetical protein
MEFTVRITDRSIVLMIFIIAAVSAVGIGIAQTTPDPGHSWSEISCLSCITTSNLADNSVTAAKANFNYAGSSSEGGPASSVAWASITGRPAGLDDGDQDTLPSCSWSGWGGTSCISYCQYGCESSITMLEGYCSGNRITQLRSASCCVACATSIR